MTENSDWPQTPMPGETGGDSEREDHPEDRAIAQTPGTPSGVGEAAHPVTGEVEERELYVSSPRKAPKYGRFIGFGMIAGVLAALALYVFGPDARTYEGGDVFIVLNMYTVPLGGFLGAVLALIIDARSVKKSSQ